MYIVFCSLYIVQNQGSGRSEAEPRPLVFCVFLTKKCQFSSIFWFTDRIFFLQIGKGVIRGEQGGDSPPQKFQKLKLKVWVIWVWYFWVWLPQGLDESWFKSLWVWVFLGLGISGFGYLMVWVSLVWVILGLSDFRFGISSFDYL